MTSSPALLRSISSMEYAKYDSRGTEDYPSLQHINWTTQGEHFSAAAGIPLATAPYGMDLTDMEVQIHCIETEAYSAVLRAFVAQSDVLSWDKEGLISELRKELRISDVEHREILGRADSDDLIKMIREKRSTTAIQPEPVSISMVPPSRKLKTAHALVSSSPKYFTGVQPSPAAFPSLTMHCSDNELHDDTAIFSTRGIEGHGLKSVAFNSQVPSLGRGIVSVPVRPTVSYLSPGIDNFKKGSGTIRLQLTDNLIHEVETIFTAGNPDRSQIVKAMLILKEHEGALLKALEKISDVSDVDDSHNHPHSNDEAHRNDRHGNHHAFYRQADRKRGFLPPSLHIPPIDLQHEDGDNIS